MATWQNVGGTWKSGNWWMNVAGTWKQCNVWKNVAGIWKNVSTFFTPDGGSAIAEDLYTAVVQLSCSVPAVWTYSGGNVQGTGGSVNLASGGTSTSITFQCVAGGSLHARTVASAQWTVSATANGITRDFTVQCFADGDG